MFILKCIDINFNLFFYYEHDYHVRIRRWSLNKQKPLEEKITLGINLKKNKLLHLIMT